MDECFRCGRTAEEVRLFTGVYINDTISVCEKCSLIESIPLLKNPSTDQLKKSEKTDYVYKRLKTIAGIKDKEPKKSVFEELQEIEEHPELEKPEEKPMQFVENFHWIIQRERRRKGMTHEHLAQNIGESASALRLIERNSLPEDAIPVIKKLEQYFRIKLIEAEEEDADISPMPARVPASLQDPAKVLSFKKDKLKDVTISDLKEMQRMVNQDFPKKTSEQLGKEQLEEFGKSEKTDTSYTSTFSPKSWSEEYFKKREQKKSGSGIIPSLQKSVAEIDEVPSAADLAALKPQEPAKEAEKVPSISDLAERKGIRPSHDSAEKIIGSEIEIADEGNKQEAEESTPSNSDFDSYNKEKIAESKSSQPPHSASEPAPESKQEPKELLGDEIEIIEAEKTEEQA